MTSQTSDTIDLATQTMEELNVVCNCGSSQSSTEHTSSCAIARASSDALERAKHRLLEQDNSNESI